VTVHELRPEHRQQGAEFDRFGLFNAELPGNELTAYFDDLFVDGKRLDLTTDPKWEGKNNRAASADRLHYGANDFGYSAAVTRAADAARWEAVPGAFKNRNIGATAATTWGC
jgi:hypothetical protein